MSGVTPTTVPRPRRDAAPSAPSAVPGSGSPVVGGLGVGWTRRSSDGRSTVASASDLLDLDSEFNDTELALRATIREFVDRRIRPGIAGWFEEARFPTELIPEMAGLGLLGMHLSGYGCAAAPRSSTGSPRRSSRRATPGSAPSCPCRVRSPCRRSRSSARSSRRATWLPRMARGEAIGCFGLTEASAGSDPASMRTTARLDGGEWVLEGSKRWIGLASIADVAVIWARTEEGVRGFLVPTGTPGFSALPITGKLSMRASIQCDVVLSDLRLPESAMLPGARGLQRPLLLPERSAVRDRLGCDRRCARQLRPGARLRAGAHAVRSSDRRLPADAGEARRHGAGDPEGAAGRAPDRATQGRRQGRAAHDLVREAEQHAGSRSTSLAPRAPCSEATASRSTTRRCATRATSSRCAPTKAPTRSIRSCSGSGSRASPPSGERRQRAATTAPACRGSSAVSTIGTISSTATTPNAQR